MKRTLADETEIASLKQQLADKEQECIRLVLSNNSHIVTMNRLRDQIRGMGGVPCV